jgi:23S rRNA (cytidine1920-2'-O)/16S rRNA (cytidine1409-2'-O)-methyltransferase
MTEPMRVDVLLVQQGLAASRTAAQGLIEAGRVSVDTGGVLTLVTKASLKLAADTRLAVAPDAVADRYVSRGGHKLAGALAQAGIDVAGWTCLDVGLSTGGFADCLLQAGAARVVGVDVGHDQLHPRLRGEPRLIAFDGVNARTLEALDLQSYTPARAGFDLAVADVSFISLTLVLPSFAPLLRPGGRLVCLVKPQFEVGRVGLGRGGLVRDAALYPGVRDKIEACARGLGLMTDDWFDSPILGGDGNREFFLVATHP